MISLLLLTPPTGPTDDFERALDGVESEVFVLVRRPGAPDPNVLTLARRLATRTRVLVHRRPDLAQLAGARGVHLPERGLPVAEARALLGPGAIVGVSRHDAAGLAASAGADYATLSPLFAVPHKGSGLGAEGFAAARRAAPSELRVLALGGVNATTAPAALAAGADGLAVLRGATDARAILDTLHGREG